MLTWDPPHRLVNGKWEYEPDLALASAVELRFVAEGAGRTRVESAMASSTGTAKPPAASGPGSPATVLAGDSAQVRGERRRERLTAQVCGVLVVRPVRRTPLRK